MQGEEGRMQGEEGRMKGGEGKVKGGRRELTSFSGEIRKWVYSKYEERCIEAYDWNVSEIVSLLPSSSSLSLPPPSCSSFLFPTASPHSILTPSFILLPLSSS
jgi:hypothetical protein